MYIYLLDVQTYLVDARGLQGPQLSRISEGDQLEVAHSDMDHDGHDWDYCMGY